MPKKAGETSEPPELEFQAVVSCLTQMLGTQAQSSGKCSAAEPPLTPQDFQTFSRKHRDCFYSLWVEKNVKYGKDWKLYYSKISYMRLTVKHRPWCCSDKGMRRGAHRLPRSKRMTRAGCSLVQSICLACTRPWVPIPAPCTPEVLAKNLWRQSELVPHGMVLGIYNSSWRAEAGGLWQYGTNLGYLPLPEQH